MIKFLEVPDLHFDPAWYEITVKVFEKVIYTANEEKVDFVVFPADITNRALLASDQGKINILRDLFKWLGDVCPMAAVYGTPSHEPPCSLDHLKDCGLVILEPGKVYGFDHWKRTISRIKRPGLDHPEISAILFGFPEISKKNFQSVLNLPAEKANAEAINCFRDYLQEYIAPTRAFFSKIPAIGVLHGVVSDSHRENSSDVIIRASDIVISTDDLRIADLDRWSLGHIHTPWESSKISAGYAGFTGIDSNPWGKTDFLPAMNLVKVDDCENVFTYISTIRYGTPARKKIYSPEEATNNVVAYWLHSSDKDAALPDFVHPWSKVTYSPPKKEKRIVSAESRGISLKELFLLSDPDLDESLFPFIESIPDKSKGQNDHKNIVLTELEVCGCTLFKGKRFYINFDDLQDGLTCLLGGNGSGKSSAMAFMSAFPVIIGKDTNSGRMSAIKDFFNQPKSSIKKTVYVNGIIHQHFITIKGAHTNSPKCECYLTIDGTPSLDLGTFDEMLKKCQELYGSLEDYILTSFSIQPQQCRGYESLMSASVSTMRDLVHNIAGIDREKERAFARDKARSLKERTSHLKSWLAGAESSGEKSEALAENLEEKEKQLEAAQKKLLEAEKTGRARKLKYNNLYNAKQKVYLLKSEIKKLEYKITHLKIRVQHDFKKCPKCKEYLEPSADYEIDRARKEAGKAFLDIEEKKKQLSQISFPENQIKEAFEDMSLSSSEIIEINKEISELELSIKTKKQSLEKARKIKKCKEELWDKAKKLEAWDYIAKMLLPENIPTIELNRVIDAINERATDLISSIDDGRYSFSTGEKFDIEIHDSQTGETKSIIKHSPGEKSLFSDAYTKALIMQRNESARISYSPIILDETDGPIQTERIADFYRMQSAFWSDCKVIVTTHNPASHEHIENRIDVEELLR